MRAVTIRYYIHAWQGLLMFLAGIVSVLAAFGGYLNSGGGEELLRRALHDLFTGKIQFDPIQLNWKAGKLVVNNLSYDQPYEWPKRDPIVRVSGLDVAKTTVEMDFLPWPPWPPR